jgi:hypothetical protein
MRCWRCLSGNKMSSSLYSVTYRVSYRVTYRVINHVTYHVKYRVSYRVSYRGTSLIRNSPPLGSYSGTLPRALWWSQGKEDVSYERSTPKPRDTAVAFLRPRHMLL